MSEVARIVRATTGYPVVITGCVFMADCDDSPQGPESLERYKSLAEGYDLSFRIYRTPAGFRLVCVSDLLRPAAPVSQRLLVELGSDPGYGEIAIKTHQFGARIGGKPERMGITVPANFDYYALLPRDQRRWDETYEAANQGFRACAFLLQTSECEIPSVISNFIALHDERTKCFSDLPLA